MNENNYKKVIATLCTILSFVIIGSILWYSSDPSQGNSDLDTIAYGFPAALSILSGIVIVVLLIMGAGIRNELNKPVVTKKGEILDKSRGQFGDILTIEFEDGTRQQLTADSGVVLTSGDQGEFDIRGEYIVGFHK